MFGCFKPKMMKLLYSLGANIHVVWDSEFDKRSYNLAERAIHAFVHRLAATHCALITVSEIDEVGMSMSFFFVLLFVCCSFQILCTH